MFASKRTEKVRLVLDVHSNALVTTVEFWSITTERRGETVFGTDEEINPWHYEVFPSGESGQ